LSTAIAAWAPGRLGAWASVEGFIVRNGGGTAANPSHRFRCIFHGMVTKTDCRLKDRVERDEKGRIVNKRQRVAVNCSVFGRRSVRSKI
jgi:hypothetical protein